jgi:hypothetical protein
MVVAAAAPSRMVAAPKALCTTVGAISPGLSAGVLWAPPASGGVQAAPRAGAWASHPPPVSAAPAQPGQRAEAGQQQRAARG